MAEVPEHLLQRSRERRAALGLGGDGADEGAAPAAGAATPAPVAAATPAAPPPPPEPEPEPIPDPPFVEYAKTRTRIPIWALPVLVALPLWGYFYAAALDPNQSSGETGGPLDRGAEVYATNCASCHGATGGGGVGPKLSDGEILLTFPDYQGHLDWVSGGSTGGNQPYGAADRAGGQRLSGGGMPGFEGQLSEEDIAAVVLYERVRHGGADEADEAELAAKAGGEHGGDTGGH